MSRAACLFCRTSCRQNWGLYQALENAKAQFRATATRVMQHSEAICALRGGATEESALRASFAVVVRKKQQVFRALLRYNASMTLFYDHLLGTMYCAFVIGPGAFREDGDTSLEQAAQLRADVGYQFILMIQMMTSVGQIVRIYDGYKKLTGNAARFVRI